MSISPSAEFKISSEAVSEKNDFVLIREDIDSLSDNEQIILKASSNFTDSLSTFSLSGPDANKFEINNQGEVRAKDLSNGSLIGGINLEKQIYNITVTESRPDEEDAVQNFTVFSEI